MLTSSYKPSPGRFLVSEPFMHDYNFKRSVVLLVEHNSLGSMGFVMNRQLNVAISEVVEGMPALESPVLMGGPVEQSTLHFIHRMADLPGAKPVCNGIYWGGDFEDLKRKTTLGQVAPADVLFFVGYSGWGPNQLEQELERKSWIIAPEAPGVVFQPDHSDLWRQVLQSMGTKYRVISNYPVDPRMN
ncbi:MAG: YqgE/AlgH family protein [Bacteroidia bacterium]